MVCFLIHYNISEEEAQCQGMRAGCTTEGPPADPLVIHRRMRHEHFKRLKAKKGSRRSGSRYFH